MDTELLAAADEVLATVGKSSTERFLQAVEKALARRREELEKARLELPVSEDSVEAMDSFMRASRRGKRRLEEAVSLLEKNQKLGMK